MLTRSSLLRRVCQPRSRTFTDAKNAAQLKKHAEILEMVSGINTTGATLTTTLEKAGAQRADVTKSFIDLVPI